MVVSTGHLEAPDFAAITDGSIRRLVYGRECFAIY